MRPNILLVLADDLGYSDIGCYGGEIETPNLDRLAQNGARFTDFYNCARCCPTRASLLTGLYPHQAGIGHMTAPHNAGPDTPAYQGYLNRECVTIAEVLREGGYATMMSGKWHVGEGPDQLPLRRGFDRFWGIARGGANYFAPHLTRRKGKDAPSMLLDDGKPVEAEGYFTDLITDRAVSFIQDRPKERPFFLYVAYTAPHWPLHAPREAAEKYNEVYRRGWDALRKERFERQVRMGLIRPGTAMTPRDPRAPAWRDVERPDWESMRMAVYAAQVEAMDKGIGRIVAELEREGILDDTLIMFLSDNGACAEELVDNDPSIIPGPRYTWASYGLPWANLSNTPIRLYKHWVHEGGIATPFILHWPGVARPGSILRHPVHVIDTMATCVDVSGSPYPERAGGHPIPPMEGESLVPLLKGEKGPERTLFWEHEGNRAVRQGKWKLVSLCKDATSHARQVLSDDEDESWHLYDLESDRTEMNNLAGGMPDKVTELATRYHEWADRVGVRPWGS